MATTTKKNSKAAKKKIDLTPIPNHPLKKWFGSSENDPYWEEFMAAIKKERAKSQRLFRKATK